MHNKYMKHFFLNGFYSSALSSLYTVKCAELGIRYFFPGSLIAKSLICYHGLLSLKRYFSEFPGLLTAKLLLKKQWFATVMFAKTLNR